VRTLFEVIAPLLSFLILIAVRQSQDFYQQSPDCQFKPTALASKGPLVALRSFCFLGVCRQGNQSFGVDSGLLNDTETDGSSSLQPSCSITSMLVQFSAAQLLHHIHAGPVLCSPAAPSHPCWSSSLQPSCSITSMLVQFSAAQLLHHIHAGPVLCSPAAPSHPCWSSSLQPSCSITSMLVQFSAAQLLHHIHAGPVLCKPSCSITSMLVQFSAAQLLHHIHAGPVLCNPAAPSHPCITVYPLIMMSFAGTGTCPRRCSSPTERWPTQPCGRSPERSPRCPPTGARWDLSVSPSVRVTLSMALLSSGAVPTLVCSGASSGVKNWMDVKALCNQTAFRNNLKDQFELDKALDQHTKSPTFAVLSFQMTSTLPNKQTISVELSDVTNIVLLFQEKLESSDWRRRRRRRGGGGGGSSGSSITQLLDMIDSLSRLVCGSGATVFTQYADSLRARMGNQTGGDATMPPTTVAPGSNSSIDLSVLIPPEDFCYNTKYQNAIFGGIKQLASSLGFGSIFDIIFGVIPYYPDVPQTRNFLSKLNETFLSMSMTSYLAENFTQDESPRIANFLANSSQMESVRNALTTCSNVLGSTPYGLLCSNLSVFLAPYPDIEPPSVSMGNWRDLLDTVDSLMRRLYFSTACFRMNKLYGFESEPLLENYTNFLIDEFGKNRGVTKPKFIASLVFDKLTPSFTKYRLRYEQKSVDGTRNFKVLDRTFRPRPRNSFPTDFKYFTSFFLHIQELLEHGIQAAVTGVNAPFQTYINMFPSACFQQDNFANVMGSFLPMIMTISWIYNVSLLVNAIVYEKETRLKEMMKIMGLSDGVHWVSWFITSLIIMVIASAFMVLLLKTGQLVVYSDPLLLFLFIVSFVVSTICEAFFISIFFSNSSVAAAFAGVIYFLGYVPYSVVDSFSDSMTRPQYLLSCLIPQLAFGVGCKFIGSWELASVGLQHKNFYDSPLATSEFTFNQVVVMMWIDSGILMLLTWYLEKVFPGAYGVPKPWYFPFSPSYWCGQSKKALTVDVEGGIDNLGASASSLASSPVSDSSRSSQEKPASNGVTAGVELNGHNSSHFEDEPKHLSVGISVRNLTKVYEPGRCACKKNAKPFTAVDNLSYNFYEGQVTSFLGHNGAGKSTTMSLLTGLYTPTSGTAFIGGYDIRTEMDQIRQQLGLCPQHNVLFDTLTVEDHIYFYGMLKGLSRAEVAQQVDSFIADVGLQKKKYEISKNLSGGMKRKLSVAMAFVGGSKVVVLDEPTAGVDPHARRSIWDVLAKFRQGRTIILTTHHMDEADILGDRICIINKGRLVCSGSPMFLKKVFGEGYTLTLVKASLDFDTDKVLSLVQSEVSEASLGECTSSEISIKLPYSSVPLLAGLFASLDEKMANLNIATYGIEDSSLEEIFLAVTGCSLENSEELLDDPSVVGFRPTLRESVRRRQLQRAMLGCRSAADSVVGAASEDTPSELPINSSSECICPYDPVDDVVSSVASAVPSTEPASLRKHEPSRTRRPLWQQIKALWLKRFHVLRRSKIGFLAEFVLPAVFILLTLALLQIVPKDGDSPPMELAPWYMLGKPERSRLKDLSVFQSRSLTAYPNNHSLTDLSNRLMLHMNSTDFLGTRCMREDVFSNPDFPCKTQRRGSVWSETPSNLPSNTSWCQCSYKDYPNSAKCVDWPTPARKSLMSSDIVESMQGYNLTNYIQSTVMEYYRKRFGGYTLFVNDSQPVSADAQSANVEAQHFLRTLNNLTDGNSTDWFIGQVLSYLESVRLPANLSSIVNQVWFDNRGYVSGPAYLNTLSNAIMRALANKSIGSPDQIGVSGWTHPITPRTTYIKNVLNANTVVSAMTVVSIIFALSFIPASFVLFLISERTTNAKHLQFVSGINPTTYWIVNHIWNLLNYMVPLTIVILLFVAFKNYEFVGSQTIGPFLLTMVLFGFASAPLMYPFSWVMTVPSKAFTMLACLNLGIGFTTTMSVTIVRMIGEQNNDQSMINTADTLKAVFLLLPHFCLGQSLMELNIYYQINVRLAELMKQTGASASDLSRYVEGFDAYDNPWSASGRYLACLVAHSVVYFALVLLLEYNCCCKQGLVSSRFFRLFYRAEYERALRQPEAAEIDDDVLAEAAKVDGAGASSYLLELQRLVKIFSTSSGPRAAVKGISLGVKSQECFGFLGVNGAGKTTTFKMLTGDLTPTSGDARVGGFSILTEALEVHKQLGYCPQFDALLPLLTGRETLQLYARIRGVEEEDIDQLVETISKRVGIEAHLDKTTQEYSGGNKRKLSCGIAFIGNPPIVFLDEPTAGMDPGARRFLWRCIQRMNKFGQGFTIFLRVRQPQSQEATSASASASATIDNTEGQLERAHEAFISAFPDAVLCENHAAVLQYQLKQTVRLRTIFESVQRLKDNGLVLDYSVNQTTLDQVFINFAKNQTETSEETSRKDKGLLKRLKKLGRKKPAARYQPSSQAAGPAPPVAASGDGARSGVCDSGDAATFAGRQNAAFSAEETPKRAACCPGLQVGGLQRRLSGLKCSTLRLKLMQRV
uniref:ABC2_membrane domain-containing protein n=1 Tax=Macrostomum lignano TaxID=282301 RepID=A0A1I8FY36_9PLAT